MSTSENINKDLILREKLAISRTKMAIERTFLSYLRTALYFSIAGMTVNSLFKIEYAWLVEIVFWILSFIILGIGIRQTRSQYTKLADLEKHIGNYQLAFDED